MSDIKIICINNKTLILNSALLESMEFEERHNTLIFRSASKEYFVTCRANLEYGEYPVDVETYKELVYKLFDVKLN